MLHLTLAFRTSLKIEFSTKSVIGLYIWLRTFLYSNFPVTMLYLKLYLLFRNISNRSMAAGFSSSSSTSSSFVVLLFGFVVSFVLGLLYSLSVPNSYVLLYVLFTAFITSISL